MSLSLWSRISGAEEQPGEGEWYESSQKKILDAREVKLIDGVVGHWREMKDDAKLRKKKEVATTRYFHRKKQRFAWDKLDRWRL